MSKVIFRCDGGKQWYGLLQGRFHERLRGWLLRKPTPAVQGLLLFPCNAVHFLGTREPLDVLFLSSSGLVLRHHRHVRPFTKPRSLPSAWGVLELVSESCPSEWEPRRFTWRSV